MCQVIQFPVIPIKPADRLTQSRQSRWEEIEQLALVERRVQLGLLYRCKHCRKAFPLSEQAEHRDARCGAEMRPVEAK